MLDELFRIFLSSIRKIILSEIEDLSTFKSFITILLEICEMFWKVSQI